MGGWRRWAAGAALLCAPQMAAAQTADELVAKNLEARGGAAKLAAIGALRFDGKVRFPGDFELTYQETRARGPVADQVRYEMALQGLTIVQAYDGSGGWRINPFEGRRDAERMSADEARSLADSALIGGPLQSAPKAGSTVAYLGREDFDGTDAYKLKVTERDGDEFVYLLDPDTFLEIKVTETRRLRGAPVVTEYELGDYEKVGEVYFPMSIESWSQGQPNQRQRVIIASAQANPSVAPALFAEPRGGASAAASSPQPAPIDQAKDAAPTPQNVPELPEKVNPADPPSDPTSPDPTPSSAR
ncbi:MAG: hypothetical protein JWL74_398 [Alphaproteobacteria bacterium]|jgi:hypothetical protein|nr:hypothetical protein [Alphaproteobacteria bacterium]